MAGSRFRGNTVDGTAYYGRSSHHPIFAIVLGLIMVLIFLWGLMIQIETSEAMLLGGQTVSISFSNWEILQQLPTLFTTGYPMAMAMAVFLAWSIEAAYFAAIIFFEHSRNAVSASGVLMEKVFVAGITLCILYNMISDYYSGTLGSGMFGHIAFSLLMTFVEAFFGIIGVALITRGWRETR